MQLFLVEDNDDIAFVTRLCLERAGHQVTVCHTGADALIVLGHSTYDLVLLDYILPDMKASNRWESIDELINNLVETGKISSADAGILRSAVHAVQGSIGTYNRFLEWWPLEA